MIYPKIYANFHPVFAHLLAELKRCDGAFIRMERAQSVGCCMIIMIYGLTGLVFNRLCDD